MQTRRRIRMEVHSVGETTVSSVSQTNERKRHESSQHLVLALPVPDDYIRGCYVLPSIKSARGFGLGYRWRLPLVCDARHHWLTCVPDIDDIGS